MKVKTFIILLVVFYSTQLQQSLWSQDRYREYDFINIKDGISKTAVSSIIQDHYGFIWIGTNGAGLYRYDGIDYMSYKHEPKKSLSISSSMIYCSYVDKKNRLWIGTENGLNLYDRELDQFTKICLSGDIKKQCSEDVAVSSLTADNEGNLFVGAFEKGLFRLDMDTFMAHHVPNVGSSSESGILNVNALKTDHLNNIYAGTNIGLKYYNTISKALEPYEFHNDDQLITIKEPIQSLLIDKQNNIWIGSQSSGVYRLNREKSNIIFSNFPVTSKRILSLLETPEGSILCGTENDGLIHLNAQGDIIKNYSFDKTNSNSIRSNSIWSLCLDKDQRIWMGYYNSGIGISDQLYDKFKNIESIPNNTNSLEVSSVTGITQDQAGRLWMSMDGGGIDIYDFKDNKFIHVNKESKLYAGLLSRDIQTVFIDSNQNIWAGSWNNGIYFLKKGGDKFVNFSAETTNGELISNSVLTFDEDNTGRIWIGTFGGGIVSYDPETSKITHHDTKEFTEHGLHTVSIRKIFVDSENNVWVGSVKGLFKIDISGKESFSITSMRDQMTGDYYDPLISNHILSIYESSNGLLWIGTKGAGLCKFDKTKNTFFWCNEELGLKEENVAGIIESNNGNLWISGNEGLHKIDIQSGEVTNYNINDGLLANDFNFNSIHKDKEGNLYFGGYKGVDFFNPEDIVINNNLPSLYLTGFKLFNKKVDPNEENSPFEKVISETDSISLTHEQSVFTIEFTGINYTRPEKNQYAYYLEGLEEDWNYVGNTRAATYTNLDYGNYTFKLKAANNDGLWNDESLNLKITILPPWWKTKWAILIYLFMFFLAIYMLNKITKERVKEKQLIKYEREQRLKEEELHKKKLQFFTNISHEFRTPLTLIINPLIDIVNKKNDQLSQEVKEKLLVIYKNTNRLSRLIDELMDFRKLEINKFKIRVQEVDIYDFVKEIVSYFDEEALHKKINLTVVSNTENLRVWVDKSIIEKVIFNLLSNAFKVTPENGEIEVTIKENIYTKPDVENIQSTYEIKVRDTGPGLKKEQLSKIFERFYQVNNLNKWYYGGTGIGLEVVRSFIELHKGQIAVESELNIGTVFTITLPIGKSRFSKNEVFQGNENPEIIKTQSINSQEEDNNYLTTEEDSKKSRLLVVEDNTELRDYLEQELQVDYKVFTARNGKEGLKVAKNVIPDIIITDVIMQEMDGFTFSSKIKENIQTSHIPILMLTAKTMKEDQLKGIESGADIYLCKPFELRFLKSQLARLLSSRQILFNKYFGAITDTGITQNPTSLDKDFIEKVLKFVSESISDPNLNVETLAYQLGLSRSQFYRKIKGLTGESATQFLRKIRLQRAKEMLEKEECNNISDVCYKVGFSSPSYFTKCFKNHFGVLPTEIEHVNNDG
ncbi:hybrid sensor histidine kinase/response regulator transcription factor [uncultured Aquimarina sp.]|uniref:hybrid sensor histidine kinase/response regulator transcription factor n=1 Tax=uncultured Aquimarina sp. TaxID=575652 RepID=UPI0026131456|nr:hybrid sensor histidine kinase/response regulator transcription factor [uncultured Aquimarina sp.]